MSKYFSISSSWKKLQEEKGALNTALNTGALIGKTVGNVAIFGVTEIIPAVIEQSIGNTKKKLESGEGNISSTKRQEYLDRIDEYEKKKHKD